MQERTSEQNKALARERFRAFGEADRAWMQDNIPPGYVRRDTAIPFDCVGAEGVGHLAEALRGAFPEIELDIQDMVAEGDKVLVRLQFRGVHSGPFGGFAATGKRFEVMAPDLFRMENGEVAERWPAIDNIGLQQRIGVIPA